MDSSWQDFMYEVDVVADDRREWDKLAAKVKSGGSLLLQYSYTESNGVNTVLEIFS